MNVIELASPPTPKRVRLLSSTLWMPAVWGPPTMLPSAQAKELYRLMVNDPGQKRKSMMWNQKLADIAERKAISLLATQEYTHNLGDITPNEMVKVGGFALPDGYERQGNNVESLCTNSEDVVAVWAGLKNSPPHRSHVLGLDPFFARQNAIGVGYWKAYDYDPSIRRLWVMWVILSIQA